MRALIQPTGDLHTTQMTSGMDILAPAQREFLQNPNTAVVIAPTLQKDYDEFDWNSYDPAKEKGISPNTFFKIVQAIVQNAFKDDIRHPYHNLDHVLDVIGRVYKIIPLLKSPFAEHERQCCLIAAWAHDALHCGEGYRQLCKRDIIHKDKSNEEASCIFIDEILKEAGFSVPMRLRIQGIILATSFGQLPDQVPPEHRELLARPYQPHTIHEIIVAFCDVAPFDYGKEFKKCFVRALNVVREMPEKVRPVEAKAFVRLQRDFHWWHPRKERTHWIQGFASGRLDLLKEHVPKGVYRYHRGLLRDLASYSNRTLRDVSLLPSEVKDFFKVPRLRPYQKPGRNRSR